MKMVKHDPESLVCTYIKQMEESETSVTPVREPNNHSAEQTQGGGVIQMVEKGTVLQ